MPSHSSFSKVGVYVDLSNMYYNGGNGMQFGVLREFACRDGAEVVRLNAYAAYDVDRAKHDQAYFERANRFHSALRDFGYKVIIKEVKWYEEENGERMGKANADLDLAVDMLLQSENLDRVLLATGDGDFTQVVRALQNKGCRVEVVAFDNVSSELRREADMYMSGYLVPNLLPTASNGRGYPWGEIGSYVRGVCYFHKDDYGFMRVMKRISPDLWLTDPKRPDSAYLGVYFHDSKLPRFVDPNRLPSNNCIFEFQLVPSDRIKEQLTAHDIRLISRPSF